jgi:hypothetical protein
VLQNLIFANRQVTVFFSVLSLPGTFCTGRVIFFFVKQILVNLLFSYKWLDNFIIKSEVNEKISLFFAGSLFVGSFAGILFFQAG